MNIINTFSPFQFIVYNNTNIATIINFLYFLATSLVQQSKLDKRPINLLA